ncbi:MAG: S-layer glycoprotein N-glycosyltransferase AglJ [Archaeoglobus sp.]|uniref:S-layer glycoprotein N-glycosyltransferase AglJ n=1 Tax=Archaeoglobus sp. TaxID=1872626 RepID=UPI001D969729|nr:S-layer glycoprotein N-glycosyltransferase AglJ [Archaeoglobus sp.]MBO8178998.1 S-layer glycoprotein N-glycosyltransferase AglJ [Archaeoglobus sp.]
MDVTVVIPTLNEEEAIGEVVEGFVKKGFKVLVIDGNSKDRTREIAREKGAEVVIQSGKGKGQAVAEAFEIVESDILVLVDGDGTYLPEEVDKLLDPILKGKAEHVVGNRFANFEKGAFTKLNLIGNKLLNMFFRLAYGVELRDILSGYRALKREVYKSVELTKPGFEVETELTVETLAKGFRIVEVPITYRKRGGKTKLNPLRDGFRIGRTIYELMSRYSPARYLYLFGLVFIIAGILAGAFVVYEWFHRVTHYLLAILTTLFIITGVQLIMFGLIADFIFRSNVEFRKELRRLREAIESEGKRD